jgi:hypothetical protein
MTIHVSPGDSSSVVRSSGGLAATLDMSAAKNKKKGSRKKKEPAKESPPKERPPNPKPNWRGKT